MATRSNAKKKRQTGKSRSTGKAGGKVQPKASGRNAKPPDRRKLREELTSSVLNESKEIMTAAVTQARSGSHQFLKLLFEFAGLWEPLPEEPAVERGPRSLEDILISHSETAKMAREHEAGAEAGTTISPTGEAAELSPGMGTGQASS